jgi:ubiquinone/menaquinone biosynthesis C-methylase UbiE
MRRTPEPATLTPFDEAREYHLMDHGDVNRRFVDDLLRRPVGTRVIDLGCGPAAIAIELCRRDESIEMIAIDAEVEMLEIAKREIDAAGLLDRVALHHADVCEMQFYSDEMADTVISNSLIHHLDHPEQGLVSALRLTKKGGRLFIRDLVRPDSEREVESLVAAYSGQESENAQQLFRQSLHAALTLEEIREMARGLGIHPDHVQMTSDRHWTIDWSGKE